MEDKNYLKDKYYLSEGRHESLFSGISEVSYYDISELPEEYMYRYPDRYFLLGTMEDIYSYKNSFHDIYGGKIPTNPMRNSVMEATIKLIWIWSAIGLIVAIITYYHTVHIRKEIVLKLTMGESIFRIVLSNCFFDTILYTSFFMVALLVIYNQSLTFFLCEITFTLFAILILLIIGINLLLLCTDIKLALSNYKMSYSLIKAEYFIKVILIFSLSISAASGISIITKYLSMKEQAVFYEQYRDYSYVVLKNSKELSIYDLETFFYSKYYTRFDIAYAGIYAQYGEYESGKMAIGINSNLKEYLFSTIPSVESYISEREGALLIPENNRLTEDELHMLCLYTASFCNCSLEKITVVYYEEDVFIDYYDNYAGYERKRNPIIIYDNSADTFEQGCGIPVFFQKCMMNVDEDEMNRFCDENSCSYSISNVWKCFEYELVKYRRGAIIHVILIIFQYFTLMMISLSIIRMEFDINRLEIILRKINGEPFVSRIMRFILPTLISGIIAITGVFVAFRLLDIKLSPSIPISIIGMIVTEILLSLAFFCKTENDNIQKTLKGGF